MRATYSNPNSWRGRWSRRNEVLQRIGNCKRFLVFAWMSLWTDSTLLAAVFLNSARAEGDLVISRIVSWDGNDSGDLTGGEENT
jgi:hypothetical protein